MPHSAYFTAVTTEVTPGQDTSLRRIIETGPQSGHLRRASVVADELVSKEEHRCRRGPGREGAKTNVTQRAPDKRRCSSGLLWSGEIMVKGYVLQLFQPQISKTRLS